MKRRSSFKLKLVVFFYLSIVMLLGFSCASSTAQRNFASDDFSDVKAEDFLVPRPAIYQAGKDSYNIDASIPDALLKESLSRLSPNQLDGLMNSNDKDFVAVSYCYKGDFEKAFALFDENYNRYKDHPTYWNELGSCYFLQGSNRKALVFYNKARTINEKYAPAVNNIGVVYLKQGKEGKALAAFKEASKLNPFALTPAFNLAQLYLKYALIDDAGVIFEALQKSNAEDPDVLIGLATIFLYKGDAARSLAYFSRLSRAHLRRPEAGINYALSLSFAGKNDDAKDALSSVNRSDLKDDMATYYDEVDQYIKGKI